MPAGKWSEADLPDLLGVRTIVTGANSGLGLATTRALARRGAAVILACRSRSRAEHAIARLVGEGLDPAQLEFRPCDLSDLDSVRSFAEGVLAEDRPIDLLINNAGVMAVPYRRTADGFEMQLGTNHLGHFALTGRLLEHLAEGGRVVTVSSLTHKIGRIRFEDLQSTRRYHRWLAYGQSKLANLMFCFELQRRLERAGRAILSVAAHPGYAATNLLSAGPQTGSGPLAERIFALGNRLVAQDAHAGALPTLYAALGPDVRGGEFYGPDGLGQMQGHPTRVRAQARAHDPELGARLWQVSSELTGVRFEL